MKIGDVVMFTDLKSIYAKWFYGQVGIVKSVGVNHIRVTWLQPVKYYESFTTFSDFPMYSFGVSKCE